MNRRAFLSAWAGTALLGAAGTNLRLSRLDGRPEAVDLAASEATVLLFLSTVCPISRAFLPMISSSSARLAGARLGTSSSKVLAPSIAPMRFLIS